MEWCDWNAVHQAAHYKGSFSCSVPTAYLSLELKLTHYLALD